MKIVKRIFFLDSDESEKISGNNDFILRGSARSLPCYELEDGTILYPHYGCPAGGEVWYQSINNMANK